MSARRQEPMVAALRALVRETESLLGAGCSCADAAEANRGHASDCRARRSNEPKALADARRALKRPLDAEKVLRSLLEDIGRSSGLTGGDPADGLQPCEEDGDEYRTILSSRSFRDGCRYFGFPTPKKAARSTRFI